MDMTHLLTGVQFFIRQTTKDVSCKPGNIKLNEIRKDLIHAEKARLLCRTTLTVSMSSTECEKSMVDLRGVCEDRIPNKTSIYFQGTYMYVLSTKRKYS